MKRVSTRLGHAAGAAVAAGLLLSACGGGSDAGERRAPDLRSEDGVKRELLLVASLSDAPLDDGPTARRQSKAAAWAAKAETSACSGGGQITTDETIEDVTLVFFPVSDTFEVSSVMAQNCRESGPGFSSRTDGVSVFGSNGDASLSFGEFGSGTTPFASEFSFDGESLSSRFLGRFESRLEAGIESSRLLMDVTLNGTLEGLAPGEVQLGFGRTGAPLASDYDVATDAETLEGAFRYRTTACAGELELETLAPLTAAEASVFPSSGSLMLTSGSDSVTYTFNGNTASYVTSSGVSGTITEADLQDFDPGC